MRSRALLAVVQLAVFAGGGLVAPAVHVAWHPSGHSHGPVRHGAEGLHHVAVGRGSAIDGPAHDHDGAPHPRSRRHVHPHSHPHSHDHHVAPPAAGHSAAPEPLREEGPDPGAGDEPIDSTHGQGSLSHLGLALQASPPPLALPEPALASVLTEPPATSDTARFQPSFPRPRPPPDTHAS